MADEHRAFSDYAELLEIISGLCAGGHTGSLLIISEINCFARLVIVGGDIVYLEYRLRKGAQAIPLFREIEHGTLDFKDGKVIAHKASALPPTPELLAQLAGRNDIPPRTPAAGDRPSAPQALELIEDELTDILGPMASLVWEEHLERAGGPAAGVDLDRLVESVAIEIDDPRKAAQFRSRVRAILGR